MDLESSSDLLMFLKESCSTFSCCQVHLQTQQGGRKLGVISQTVHIGEYPLLYQMRMQTCTVMFNAKLFRLQAFVVIF
jgi:hypothetical protein